jgi:hypothetical protein
MRLRFSKLLAVGVLAAALLVTAASAATAIFATGLSTPESITPAASGSGLFVTDADGPIWNVPTTGGSAVKVADATGSVTWRGGLILPSTFTGVGGKFLAVGADVSAGGPALAYTMNTTTGGLTPYHSSSQSGAWTEAVLAPTFGSLSGDVLVTNQGAPGDATNPIPGSVDYFTPSGGVGTLATFSFSAFPSRVQPFGAALAKASFGEVGGPSLFVSDSRGNGIYTVDPAGNIKLFTTIPASGKTLRQIAFAPKEWKKYGGDLFVSLSSGAIDVVDRDGVVVGTISGAFNARGLLFTTISGQPTLLFSNTANPGHNILKAGPGDIVPS